MYLTVSCGYAQLELSVGDTLFNFLNALLKWSDPKTILARKCFLVLENAKDMTTDAANADVS